MKQYRDVTILADIMKVCSIPFLMSISKHIKFGTCRHQKTMKNKDILTNFKAIINVYHRGGFRVQIILADNLFESLRGNLAAMQVHINIVSRNEHVPEIKERVRGKYNDLPFKHYPPILILEMVFHSVFWRHMFQIPGGISPTMSPAEIVVNRRFDFAISTITANLSLVNTCKLEFGQYVQTHEEHDNSMSTRTIGAIATRPT